MAWEYPMHSCGHGGERVQMYGKMDGRARELERIERQPCPDCQVSAARKLAEAAGLPQLVGSPKQIAWASNIRSAILVDDTRMVAQIIAAIPAGTTVTADDTQRVKAMARAERTRLAAITSAHDWIEMRGSSPLVAAGLRALNPIAQALMA